MRRREFLRIGGAGCVGLVTAPGLAGGALLEPPTATALYHAPDIDRVVDARLLASGLSDLVGASIRVTVHGLAADGRAVTDRAALDVVFPALDDRDGIRVQAWAMREGGRTGRPASVTLRVPVTGEGLRLEPSWNERVFPVRLSVGREPGAAKLRFGEYRLSAGPSPGLRLSIEPADPAAPSRIRPPERSGLDRGQRVDRS